MGTTDTVVARPRLARVRATARLCGPALVAAVAYVDPGNVATNLAGGARYGYLLVWVVVAASLLAGLVQYLSAKLGLVTGASLPALLGQRLPRGLRIGYWVQAEATAVATDLAEVVGGAVALWLLFGLPPVPGALVTGAASMLLLAVQRRGQRWFERAVTALLAVVAGGVVAVLALRPPQPGGVLGGLVPRLPDAGSLLLAAGILGATVMPHAVYLHSALAVDRHGAARGDRLRRLLAATRTDVAAAMLLAGLVNLALLLIAAAALHGGTGVDTLAGGYAAVRVRVGAPAAVLFGIALLASGLAATSVGSYAGAVVMDGLLRRRVPLPVRRLATLVPAVAVLATGVDATRALIVSQVVLSFGIAFALVPLVVLTARRTVLGRYANRPVTTVAASAVCAVVVALNVALLVVAA